MSSFTQFTGNAVPFGQLLGLWENRDNPTIDGVEYLKSGVLKSSTGYSSLVSNWPSLGLNAATGTAYSYSNQPTSVFRNVYLTDGTRYYVFGGATTGIPYGTNLTSNWTSAVTGYALAQLDACRFGTSTTLLFVPTSANAGYVSTTVATLVAATTAFSCCASNTAGTLAVMAANLGSTAGNIYTSTNGTAWTSRSPTGGTAGQPDKVMWSPIGNCFIYFLRSSFGTVYTSTDGFTLTSRATTLLPTGASAEANVLPNATSASSASSTLFTARTTTNAYIARTTDGVNFTAAVAPNNTSGTLQYFNSAYYYFTTNTGLTNPSQQIWKSTDEGVTWVAVPNVIISSLSHSLTRYLDQVVLLNGNIICTFGDTSVSLGNYAVLSSYDTVNYLGVPNVTTQPAGSGSDINNANTYVRIK